jgi:hypothetical protein
MFDLAAARRTSIGEIESMSSRELSEWMAYYRIRPSHDPHWIGAQICAVIANVMGGGDRRYGIEDFYPQTTAPEALSAEDSVKALANAMKAGFNMVGRTS